MTLPGLTFKSISHSHNYCQNYCSEKSDVTHSIVLEFASDKVLRQQPEALLKNDLLHLRFTKF